MFAQNVIKEFKLFFRSKGNVLFILLFPLILIGIMSYALNSMIGGNAGVSIDKGKILYIAEEENENYQRFVMFEEMMKKDGTVEFERLSPSEASDGKKKVDKQKAYALITVTDSGFDYYRSPYNEPYAAQVIRSYFEQISVLSPEAAAAAAAPDLSGVKYESVNVKKIDSKTYYTIVELTFMIIYIAMIVGKSVFMEKELETNNRIVLAGSGMVNVILSKIVLGTVLGIVQTLIVYVFSRLVLRVEWGSKFLLMMLLLVLLSATVSAMGAALGAMVKNKVIISNTVLALAILFGLFGGMFTPIPYLESNKVIGFMMKCTPLYWVNKGMISLQQGIITNSFYGAVICCCVLIVAFMGLSISAARKMTIKE